MFSALRIVVTAIAGGLLFAFESQADIDQAGIAYLSPGERGFWQVWHVDPKSGKAKQVSRSAYDKSRVSWYPDGQHLLVNGNQGRIVKLHCSSGQETEITVPVGPVTDADISPDGKALTFSYSATHGSDANSIWHYDIATKTLKKLTQELRLQHEPIWRRDGKAIYFLSKDTDNDKNIWQVRLDKKATQPLTSNRLYHMDVNHHPKKGLVFSSNYHHGNYDIAWRDLKGHVFPVVEHPAFDASPAWSPDGKQIVFVSDRAGKANLWRVSVSKKQSRKLAKEKDNNTNNKKENKNPNKNRDKSQKETQATTLKQLTEHPLGARRPVWFQGTGQ